MSVTDDKKNQTPDEVDVETAQEMGLALRETAFDATEQTLDLSKDEKRRTTALMLAINYYLNSVVKEAAMYDAMRRDGKTFRPMNVADCVEVAVQFECFIATGKPLSALSDDVDQSNGEASGRAEPA